MTLKLVRFWSGKLKHITKLMRLQHTMIFVRTWEKTKGDCDREMIQSLDQIPYREMPEWGQTARFLINTKQKLGLGVKSKSGKRHSVMVIGLNH